MFPQVRKELENKYGAEGSDAVEKEASRRVFLYELHVAETARGRGIAAKLMKMAGDAGLSAFSASGEVACALRPRPLISLSRSTHTYPPSPQMELHVHEKNTDALDYYQKRGFKPCAGTVPDVCVLRRAIR